MKFILQQALTILTVCFISMSAVAEQAGKATAEATPAQGNVSGRLYGKVVKTMEAGSYTYVLINDGKKEHWAAGPKIELKKGDMIGFDTGMPFTNFESKTLKKKFDLIYFVGAFSNDKEGAAPAQAEVNPHASANAPSTVKLEGIKKAKGGKTIAEILKQKKDLGGKKVTVRGKVTKFSAMIMNKNWLHIQDSSGTQDLIVTTDQTVKVGDLVLVKGTVVLDQNLGSGYVYDIIVEKAKITVE